MSVLRRAVPVKVAQHVLFFLGDTNLGLDGGHFVNRLLQAVSAADSDNLAKLREAFPEVVTAWEKAAREPWGLEWLRAIVKAELDGLELGLDFTAAAS